MFKGIRILILEDNPADAELIKNELLQSELEPSLLWTSTETEFRKALNEFQPQLLLADYRLPGFDGMTALKVSKEYDPDLPFIFVSGAIGEELAIETLRNGATDYVLKDRLARLIPSVHHALNAAAEVKRRKKAEEQVHQSQEQLKILSHRLLEAQETERRHIARELHDEIGQALTAIKINLQTASKVSHPIFNSALLESMSILDRLTQQVRNLSLDLRPSLLDDLGLVAALRWYLDRQSQRAGFSAKLKTDLLMERFHTQIETACFRIVQEALTNVVRHANAKNVQVELWKADSNLHLRVYDDGRGFDVEKATTKALEGTSMGLLGMRERLSLLDGILNLRSTPGKCTEIEATFPLTPEHHVGDIAR